MRRSLCVRTLRLCHRSLPNTTQALSRKGTPSLQSTCQNGITQPTRGFSTGGSPEIIFKSPYPDGDFPEMTVSDYMFSRFEKFGDNLAMVDDVTGNKYTYSQLRPLAEKIGSYLTRQGFRKNDVICYYGTNHPEFTLLLLGCSSVGVILTTANPAYTADELKHHMAHSEAKKIVTVAPLVPNCQTAGIKNADIIVLGQADGCMPFAEMFADDGKGMPQNVQINPVEDVAILPYSSGTTGLPKGVMLTHYNIVSNLLQFKDTHITVESDINFGLLPFYHIYGLAPINLGTLQDGAKLVTTAGFDPEKFLISLQKHKVTKLHLVPPIILFLARHPIVAKFDLSSIREVVCAAAPLGASLTEEFQNRLNLPTVQGNNADIIVLGQADGCMPFAEMFADDGKGMPQNVQINPVEDVAILPYSSGTTGLPKGVMLTHYNIVSNLLQFKDTHITVESDINFGLLPFYHIYGLAPINLGTLQDGAKLVTTAGFDPEKFLISLQKHKVTKLHLVPPIILFLARHPIVAKFDLSSIREVVCAAAPLGASLTEEFQNRLNLPTVQGYGLTETSPVVSLDVPPARQGTIGRLIRNTEAKIIDTETGKSLNKNEVGELAIRGPQNMKGYLKNEQATKEMIDEQGWLHTGDSAYVTDDEYLVICDRLKELIKYKGMQVAPAELENLIHQHPAVQDVTVVGVPDERAGEIPKAFVVLKPNTDVTEHVIQNHVDGQVSDFKKLRGGVEFIQEIPKSPSGKILRRLLTKK